jgi:hypothetical protein
VYMIEDLKEISISIWEYGHKLTISEQEAKAQHSIVADLSLSASCDGGMSMMKLWRVLCV